MSKTSTDTPEECALSLLGARIREIRARRGITLAELSDKAQVSVAMLSHIERSKTSPSLKTLDRIRMALQVPLSSFFQDVDDGLPTQVVVRGKDRARIHFDSIGLVKELLSPQRGSDLEMFMLILDPSGSSGDQPWTRNGEKAGVVLEGVFELTVGDLTWRLGADDSFQFDSRHPHRFRNTGSGIARILWAIKATP